MASDIRQLELPEDLKKLILSKECVVFIGSGASCASYGSWHELVNRLCEHCGSSSRVEYDDRAEAFLAAAQDAKDEDEDAYYSFLGEYFGRRTVPPSWLYDVILSLPFESYLTVNFDPLLALQSRTARIPFPNRFRVPATLDREAMQYRSIHYLHGYIEHGEAKAPEDIVLAKSEFDRAYAADTPLRTLLIPTLVNDPIVFIGCRLKEPVMPRVFKICKKQQQERLRQGCHGSEPPKRYIFLAKPEVRPSRAGLQGENSASSMADEETYYKDMDITPVWYDACGDDHLQLRYALERLAKLPVMTADVGWSGG